MDHEIRFLTTIAELREHERLQREIWDSDTIDVPVNLLAAGARHGAIVLGAYSGGEMIGILYGFPGLTEGQLHHHSHMLGVLPEYRRHGIGLALKLRQRELARDQGMEMITWTVDPLEVGNNLFNFGSLGVTCNVYLEDAYGEMDDALNRGLPSDRLEVHWGVNDPLPHEPKVRSGSGATPPEGSTLVGGAEAGASGLLSPLTVGDARAGVALVQAPRDFRSIKAADADLALRWRLHLRELCTELFAHGYTLTGCIPQGELGCYVFAR